MKTRKQWIKPRWQKVLSDLWGNKVRTLLVVISIAVGVFAVGFVSVTFIILLTDMDADYQSVNPHEAIITSQTFSEEFLPSMEKVDGVGQVEGRSSVNVRVKVAPGKKVTMGIVAIQKISEMKIDRLRFNDGETPPELSDHEVYIERSALRAMPLKSGDILSVELADGRIRDLKVAEIVHDITAAPYMFTNRMSAYVNLNTMEWLGGSRDFNQVYLTVSKNKTDKSHVEAVSHQVAEKIKKSGREVFGTYVFQPGRHYASDFITALGMMLSFLGGLAVLLSAFLVVNTIIALLGQHIPQIGIMKLVGGSTSQIVEVYVVLILCFGFLAFLIAAPVSLPLGYSAAKVISGFFNFNVGPFRIPLTAVLLQLGIALFIPVLTSFYPVLNGTRITITEAISNLGISKGIVKRGLVDIILENIRGISRPMLVSLRNAFRRKGRLVLTLSTLTLACGIFIAVFNLWSVINLMMQRTYGYNIADVTVTLNHAYRIEQINPLFKSIPHVVGVEGWGSVPAQLLKADRQTATEILIVSPPAASKLIKPVITAGRWLEPGDENAIVIGNHLLKERPELNIGDILEIDINNNDNYWKVVGIYEIAGMMAAPVVYVNNNYLGSVLNETDRVATYRVALDIHDGATEKMAVDTLDRRLDQMGIPVNQIISRSQFFGGMIASMDAIVYALLLMAMLIAMVGGLGLMGMMSMNVMERTREIGVLRSIGASDGAVLQLVIVEGLVIGLLAWLLGVILAFPFTILLAYVFGVAMVNSPLAPAFSANGYFISLAGILIIAILASALPAKNASRLTIREILAYE